MANGISQSYLLSVQCNRRRYIPSLNRIYIANVNNLKTHFGIICARRWISYGSCLGKCTAATAATQTMNCHHSASCKPWICHCANVRIVERCKHNVRAIVRAPNCFWCRKYLFCNVWPCDDSVKIEIILIKKYIQNELHAWFSFLLPTSPFHWNGRRIIWLLRERRKLYLQGAW